MCVRVRVLAEHCHKNSAYDRRGNCDEQCTKLAKHANDHKDDTSCQDHSSTANLYPGIKHTSSYKTVNVRSVDASLVQ